MSSAAGSDVSSSDEASIGAADIPKFSPAAATASNAYAAFSAAHLPQLGDYQKQASPNLTANHFYNSPAMAEKSAARDMAFAEKNLASSEKILPPNSESAVTAKVLPPHNAEHYSNLLRLQIASQASGLSMMSAQHEMPGNPHADLSPNDLKSSINFKSSAKVSISPVKLDQCQSTEKSDSPKQFKTDPEEELKSLKAKSDSPEVALQIAVQVGRDSQNSAVNRNLEIRHKSSQKETTNVDSSQTTKSRVTSSCSNPSKSHSNLSYSSSRSHSSEENTGSSSAEIQISSKESATDLSVTSW